MPRAATCRPAAADRPARQHRPRRRVPHTAAAARAGRAAGSWDTQRRRASVAHSTGGASSRSPRIWATSSCGSSTSSNQPIDSVASLHASPGVIRPTDSSADAATTTPRDVSAPKLWSVAASRRTWVISTSTTRASARGLGSTATSMKPARSVSSSMRRISVSSQDTPTSQRRGPSSTRTLDVASRDAAKRARSALRSAPVSPVASTRLRVLPGGNIATRVGTRASPSSARRRTSASTVARSSRRLAIATSAAATMRPGSEEPSRTPRTTPAVTSMPTPSPRSGPTPVTSFHRSFAGRGVSRSACRTLRAARVRRRGTTGSDR